MNRRFVTVAVTVLLIGSIFITGCAKANKPAGTPGGAAPQESTLVVPSSFGSNAERRSFALKAVQDAYYKEAAPLLEQVIAAAPDAEAYLKLGTARYNLAQFDGAIEAWTKAAEMDPQLRSVAKNNIGNALRDSKRLNEAEVAYKDSLSMDPANWQSAINLASLYRTNSRVAEGITVLNTVLQYNENADEVKEMLQVLTQESKNGA